MICKFESLKGDASLIKMIPKYAPADLGLLSIAPQSGIVKHTKFDHVLDTISYAFWTESVHREVALEMPFATWHLGLDC